MGVATIIVNPYAGRWKARDAIPAIEAACEACGLAFELEVTDGPGHGTASFL